MLRHNENSSSTTRSTDSEPLIALFYEYLRIKDKDYIRQDLVTQCLVEGTEQYIRFYIIASTTSFYELWIRLGTPKSVNQMDWHSKSSYNAIIYENNHQHPNGMPTKEIDLVYQGGTTSTFTPPRPMFVSSWMEAARDWLVMKP